jgi:hypothetical protein
MAQSTMRGDILRKSPRTPSGARQPRQKRSVSILKVSHRDSSRWHREKLVMCPKVAGPADRRL